MTRVQTTERAGRGQSGYTMVELLVSTAIMVTITGAVFALMNPSTGNAKAQPEVADMQQRMRIGSDTLFRELVMSGAGPYLGADSGSLMRYFAPILPRRVGALNGDPGEGPNSFQPDRITLTYVPNNYSQTTIRNGMPPGSKEMKVYDINSCPKHDQLCGFEAGMRVLIFDAEGHNDMFTITAVQDDAAHLQHSGTDLNYKYDDGSQVLTAVSYTYWLDRQSNQLKRYDGWQTDLPIVDDVVDLKFEYFGDPNPPTAPKPPTGVANCIYTAGGVPALPTLAATDGSLAELTREQLSDGPYCGGGDTEFDADLLRVRKVRVTLRMQVQSSTLRGAGLNNPLFLKPGTAQGGERYVPDYTVKFEVSPRNLNLAR